ncbi:hemerythrin [Mycolicibacterium novocastrense]|uniref:hemerythrin domain-containing protein n=1 Tax=Mycolicibacterium novocastrense TaxID=59813 RepID=UPI0007490100|nr:hemerythrin domain-containing protein [Mycolicibacterium novocastrense]KUH66443.1 hemerythrin [Mycolicibacterium novocastrense]KUH72915.1 hemerythrin [Mycolicibacterium novocastrense]KUH75045.1 hemerythrin [Mycolicibacterium novocastrense]
MHRSAAYVALEHEHHEIDRAMEGFLEKLRAGILEPEALTPALEKLRRHIYLEEVIVFPPIREAGMVMPIFVMMREHGQIWRAMDTLDDLLAASDTDRIEAACCMLLDQLHEHNSKEEPIVYPHIDTDLSAHTRAELSRLSETGLVPEGWVCRHARGVGAIPR